MSLVRFDFDYDQAFLWRAENTEASLVYTEANLSVDQAFINRDISRVFVYPKNKHSNDTSKHFFSAWTHVRLPFSYKQGDMDGGSFIQHFWNYVALKKDINLMHMDLNLSLRFGYVNDEGKRCSCVIMYHLNDPSKWMACVTQDTEKKSFTERRASLFIPKYFSDELNGELKSNQNAQRFSDSEVHDQFIKTLGSALLIKPFQSFFDSKAA